MPSLAQLDAAKLALLTLRASIGRSTPVARDAVRIFSSAEILASNAAAHLLAGAPKPIVCSAIPYPEAMEIQCSALETGTPDADWYAQCRESDREHGGFMGYLSARPSTEHSDVNVYCVGRDESLLIPLSAVERWAQDYFIKRVNCRGDDVDNHLCADWPDYKEARQRGAAGILMFSSPSDHQGAVLVFG